jgi:iron complex outermembrane recepter protein
MGHRIRHFLFSNRFRLAGTQVDRGDVMRNPLRLALLACAFAPAAVCAQEEAVVVTATRFPERALAAPIGMTVINAREISSSAARTLPDLLLRLGGVTVRDNSGSPDLQVDLRGFGITGDQNTLILLDGIRLNENDLSSTKLSSIPLDSIERIEILRGSGAVLYGGGASGGAINIITRVPQPGHKEAKAYLGAGSFGAAESRASVSVAGKRFGALFSGSHYESDNYRVNNRTRQDNVTGDLRFGGADGGLTLKFGSDTQRLQLPGVRNENQLVSDPRGATNPSDWSTRDGNFVTLLGQRDLGNIQIAADLAYRDQLQTAYFASLASYNEARLRNLAFSPRLRGEWEPFGVRSSLVAGVDLSDWNYGRRIAASPSAISSPTSRTNASQGSRALYFQLNAQVTEAAKATLGWRAQRAQNELVQAGFANSTQSQTRSLRAWEAALQYILSPAWSLFGKLASSFRYATVDDNGFTATGNLLEPQTARHRETGAEYRSDSLRLRVNLYEIDLNNEIYFSPLVVPFGANTNLSPTRRSGTELFGSWRASPQLEFSGNVVHQVAKFKTGVYGGIDVSGATVPLVPRTLATLRAAWLFAQRTQLNATISRVGTQRFDNDQANTFARMMPSYSLADLKLSHDVGAWKLSASIINVFDRKYFNYGIVNAFSCATAVCAYPQAGRTAFASAQYDFM